MARSSKNAGFFAHLFFYTFILFIGYVGGVVLFRDVKYLNCYQVLTVYYHMTVPNGVVATK